MALPRRLRDAAQPLNRNAPLCQGISAWWSNTPSFSGGANVRSLHGFANTLPLAGAATIASMYKKSVKPGVPLASRYGDYNFTSDSDRLEGSSLANASGLTNTLALWMRIDTFAAFGWIIFGSAAAVWQLTGTLIYVAAFGSGSITATTSADSVWRHYVFVSGGGTTQAYINGAQVGGNGGNGTASIPAGAKTWTIGDYTTTPGGSWSGTGAMQDIIYWGGRAFTATEAARVYQEALLGYPTMWTWANRLPKAPQPAAAGGNQTKYFFFFG